MKSLTRLSVRRFGVVALCSLALAACSSTPKTDSAASTSASTAPQGPSDPQIAAIVVAANQVDIDAGKLARGKAKSKTVKDFAARMVTDHTAVQKSAGDLVKKLGVTPEESDTSRALKSGGDQAMSRLKGLKGAEFDKAYIDNEVSYHQSVLDAVDNVLIPNAKNEELKGLLVKTRPAFLAHLEHAKQLQAKVSSGK
jgi:putative membrane protein